MKNVRVNITRKQLNRIIKEEKAFRGRVTARDLISSLRQRGYAIKEGPPDITQEDAQKDSLDAQVDRHFATFESAAKTTKAEGRSWRRVIQSLIGEAPEDEEDDEGGGGEEEPEGEDEAPAEETPEEPPKMSINDIDVESFANSVARLVDNYDKMLEVRSTLVRRARTFLSKNYDNDVVDAVTDVLRSQHSLIPGKTELEVEDELFDAPRAGEAGPGGGG